MFLKSTPLKNQTVFTISTDFCVNRHLNRFAVHFRDENRITTAEILFTAYLPLLFRELGK